MRFSDGQERDELVDRFCAHYDDWRKCTLAVNLFKNMKGRKKTMAKNDTARMGAKIKKQNAEIKRLKNELKAYIEGSIQLSRALDSILAQVALKWGESTPDGATEAALPLISVKDTDEKYKVSARVGEDNGSYIIRVEPKVEVSEG